MRIGSTISRALATVGISEDRVSKLIGRPCGCSDRARWLDEMQGAVELWARRVLSGRTQDAEALLDGIIGDPDEEEFPLPGEEQQGDPE